MNTWQNYVTQTPELCDTKNGDLCDIENSELCDLNMKWHKVRTRFTDTNAHLQFYPNNSAFHPEQTIISIRYPLKSFHSQEWLRSNFSLHYQHIIELLG